LFLDQQGKVVVRVDGYYPPQRFDAVLDYVATRREGTEPLGDYLRRVVSEPASPTLHDEPFFAGPPYDLQRRTGGKPLAVVFEAPDCAPCDELHREGFRRPEVLALVRRFDVVRFALGARTPVIVPDGRRLAAQAWARELDIAYAPSIVFFGDDGREAFRISAYLRPFHLASSFDYVASGAYRTEPSFQRYIQGRADKLRAAGQAVELWR
jgi:thioredoxin-related protein